MEPQGFYDWQAHGCDHTFRAGHSAVCGSGPLLSAYPIQTDNRWPANGARVYYIGLFALQSFCKTTLAFLTGFLIRKSFMALAVFSFYFLIAEPIAVKVLKYHYNTEIGRFFPAEISDRLFAFPRIFWKSSMPKATRPRWQSVQPHVYYTIVLIILAFCFWKNDRRDL